MSTLTQRAALKARLETHGAAIGRVHDYERWSADNASFLAFFQDPSTKKIFGWEIVYRGHASARVSMSKWKVTHRFVLRGYYALQDAAATEKTFAAIVDTVALDLLRNRLAGTAADHTPTVETGPRIFGNLLCHVAEITVQVAEIVDEAPEETAPDLAGIDGSYYLMPDDDTADATDIIEIDPPT